MKIQLRENFETEMETLKANIITTIKLRINLLFKNSEKDVVKEICFGETMSSNPIFRQSDEDFSTLCIDDIQLSDNEEFTFTYSSELQDLRSGTEDDLSIDNALDILTALEDLEF